MYIITATGMAMKARFGKSGDVIVARGLTRGPVSVHGSYLKATLVQQLLVSFHVVFSNAEDYCWEQ